MTITLLHRIIALRYTSAGFERRTLQLPDATISFMIRPSGGSALPILFLHGLGTSSSSWVRAVPWLKRDRSCICPDLPGFGRSVFTDASTLPTLENLTTILDGFIEREMPGRFILLGHSLGGWLATRYALRHPDRIEQLILVNTAGVSYPGIEKQRELFRLKDPPDALKLLTTMWYRYPTIFRPFTRPVFNDLRRRHVPELVRAVRAEDLLNGSLHMLRMPVDVIWGMEDGLIDRQVLEVFRAELPHVRIYPIERCGHIPQLERPKSFAALLQTVLASR